MADALAGFGWPAAISTLYTAGLASLVGYGIFNTLLARWPSSAVVPWVLLAPVVAMASAWAILDQRPNAAEAGGGVLLLIGVLVALRPRRRRTTTTRSREGRTVSQVKIGDRSVAQLGFGAMRLTGAAPFGEAPDRDTAIAVARAAVEAGCQLVDTADAYALGLNEELVRRGPESVRRQRADRNEGRPGPARHADGCRSDVRTT